MLTNLPNYNIIFTVLVFMRKLRLLLFILMIDPGSLRAQTDSALIKDIIKDIEALQIKKDGEYYQGNCV